MMFLLSDMLYMLVRYASQSSPKFLMCPMLTLSGPVEFVFSNEYVSCDYDPSVCLGIPSICQNCVFILRM